ncbi:MAG TPA: response regulator [Candidatus Saccharimonadales bacterium]|nr:response regulator [Candidatus Saccharimonadales bacterium]
MSKKILVIDDDAAIADTLQTVLELESYIVKSLTDAGALAKTLKSFLPDLILLDVLLSGTDGHTVAANLRKNPKTKLIPLVLLSGHPDAREVSKKIKADGFIPKPFDLSDLSETIKKVLKK